MRDDQKLNPNKTGTRSILRVVGPVIAGIGLIFVIIGAGSFFSSFGSFEPPRYFWCAFVGMPMLVVGIAISNLAFMGALLRFQAREVAPVAKDTFNYMAEETADGVKTMAAAVSEGFSAGLSADSSAEVNCPQCSHRSDVDAKFCDECGTSLDASRMCSSCNSSNDADAKFCKSCGEPFVERSSR